jgi:hypothetical protein
MEFINSPFIVPVAGCLVGAVAIISGVWSDAHNKGLKAQERMTMIARGLPVEEIEKLLGVGSDEKPSPKDPLRSLSLARRVATVLVSSGAGISLFFILLSIILQHRAILGGAAVGIIPIAIGVGFYFDYNMQKRELSRFGLEVDAELPGSRIG